MASNSEQRPRTQKRFPSSNFEHFLDLTSEGQPIVPNIHAAVDGNFFFFLHHTAWTCHRHIYFNVTCSCELPLSTADGEINVQRGSSTDRVHAIGLRLSAATTVPEAAPIELEQNERKEGGLPRENDIGTIIEVAPKYGGNQNESIDTQGCGEFQDLPTSVDASRRPTGAVLPTQCPPPAPDQAVASRVAPKSSQSSPGPSVPWSTHNDPETEYTFEQVRFPSGTVNDHERGLHQEYFRLVIDLFADIRTEGSVEPVWVKVAQQTSENIVVRGMLIFAPGDQARQAQSDRQSQ